MADTLKFGPEWLRQLSSGGSMTSPPPSPSFGGKYKLAEHRYGREEMLALFTPNPKAPDDLRQFTTILVERCQDPMAMLAPTDEEQRLLASNVNSNLAYRQVMGRGGSSDRGGMRGAARGGGMASTRGRGRGRGDPSGYYSRGFDDGLPIRDGLRGRGGREGGTQKVIERDASGFLSARTFDEMTDRRSKDPFSRSTPGNRWSDLRSTSREGGRPGAPPDTPTDDPGSAPATPVDGAGRDEQWRRANKDSQPRGNWRDAKPSFDDDPGRYQRGISGFNRQMSYERSRSHRQEEDELPEWANDDMGGGDEGGTFDSSGAFMSLKDSKPGDKSQPRSKENGETPSKSTRKQEIEKAKKSLPLLTINSQSPLTHTSKESLDKSQTSQATPTSINSDSDKSTSSTEKGRATQAPPTTDNPSNHSAIPPQDAGINPSALVSAEDNSTAPREENTDSNEQSETYYNHIKAAEDLIATWSNEEDEKQNTNPANHTPSSGTGGAEKQIFRQPQLQQQQQQTVDTPDLTSAPELFDHWFYQDPQGTLQGPFTAQEMTEWFTAGYFTMTLMVKQGRDRSFQPLGEIIKRYGNLQPFAPTTPTQSNSLINRLAGGDPTLLAGGQDTHTLQQQLLIMQHQQALIQQQQQQMAILKQHQQIEQLVSTLKTREEFSQLTPQQLHDTALNLIVSERKQALLAQQALAINQQSGPPQVVMNTVGVPQPLPGGQSTSGPPVPQDEDMLWGVPANRSWKQQMRERQAVDEIAQKEAARQHEQQLLELERQRERERQMQQMLEEQRAAEQRAAEQRAVEQRAAEQRRLQEEKAKEERRKQMEEMERQKREEEERKRLEIERQELERRKQKELQIELERQREQERNKLLEQEKQKEIERKIAQEAKRKAELQRRQEEEERKQKEAMEAELARKAEQQRMEQEKAERELLAAERERERDRQLEKERLEALKLPSTAQWASSARSAGSQGMERQLSLQEIQKREKAETERQRAAAEKQRQQELLEQQNQQQQSQLKWAANTASRSPVTVGKSLREIQEEEARRLEKERKEKLNKQKVTTTPQVSSPSGGATWGSGKNLATGWANEGAWGAAVKNGMWDQPSSVKSKTSNSEVFPSLSASSKPQQQNSSNQQSKKKPQGSAQNSKKTAQIDRVRELFHKELSADDEFTEWCIKSLKGLSSSIDVPTFVAFLREVESPYEVQDYVKSYLGESAKTSQFAKDFVAKRSVANKKKQAQMKLDDEESLWGPAPAVNPPTQRNADSQATNEKKKKSGKKSKGGKMDATALLGFTVGASSHRLNIGEIEKAE